MITKDKLSRSAILELTEGGWIYFISLFPELPNAKINDNRCKNIINHLRGEQNASLSCYHKDDRWILHDHGDPDWSGDVFTIYGLINNVTEFPKIIEGIYREITGEEPPALDTRSTSNIEEVKLPEGVDFEIEPIDFKSLEKAENDFLEKFHIKIEAMKEYNSKFLSSYSFRAKSGKQYRIKKKVGEVLIAYEYAESVKIYKPFDKEYKFTWLGDKPKDYVFGLSMLNNLNDEHKKYKNEKYPDENKKLSLLLCAGEKDTLVARSMGLNSICLNSESTSFFPEVLYIQLLDLNDFLADKFQLLVLYDIDKAGVKFANRIESKQGKYDYNLKVIELPEKLAEKEGKDLADWVSLGFSKEELIDIVNNPVSPISDISPSEQIKDDSTSLEENQGKSKSQNESSENTNLHLETEISDNIVEGLPSFFREAIGPFEKEYRTMMTLAFITVLGSVTKNVFTNFRRDRLYPNLYTVIIAPPASGKSLIKWARKLIMPVEDFLNKRSEGFAKSYEHDLELVNNGEMNKSELGKEPPYVLHLIPTDITSAMWIKQISDNDGEGLMYDTEIDGLVESNSGNLRSFTDYLRKAYEGEPLSLMRKTDRERILVNEGKMSMLISGTPGQFTKLIPDAENGLFSRIVPCKFSGKNEWQNVFEPDEFDLQSHFESLSKRVLKYYMHLDSFPEPIKFSLSNEQKIKLDKVFSKRLKKINYEAGLDGRATVMRLGAITVKIAMILTMFRRFENDEVFNQNPCHTDDFNSSLKISEIVLSHVLSTLKMMKDEKIENSYRGKKRDYFYALPITFTYRESQNIAEELGINLKTAEKWIYSFRNKGFLINPEKGHYKKVA
ncbi:DUF3987 domain-containing protein [uncultured Marixanthomonas sp.]|uniref:DUF3987 domain-containing protein n=1 Tax=uncultured Marixanthomonas sp. TaxID=757245 RepID=UPI0030DA9957|tara:strand:- start:253552 stop:256071 length:2520 start_codon:yes stop_codon:yes gene_type:complete